MTRFPLIRFRNFFFFFFQPPSRTASQTFTCDLTSCGCCDKAAALEPRPSCEHDAALHPRSQGHRRPLRIHEHIILFSRACRRARCQPVQSKAGQGTLSGGVVSVIACSTVMVISLQAVVMWIPSSFSLLLTACKTATGVRDGKTRSFSDRLARRTQRCVASLRASNPLMCSLTNYPPPPI